MHFSRRMVVGSWLCPRPLHPKSRVGLDWPPTPGQDTSWSAKFAGLYTGTLCKKPIESSRKCFKGQFNSVHRTGPYDRDQKCSILDFWYEFWRSRQHWYGNEDAESLQVVQSEVSHIWPGVRTLQGTHNAARRVLDGVQVLSNTVSSLSGSTGSTAVVGQTTKTLSGWMADQVRSNTIRQSTKPYRALTRDTMYIWQQICNAYQFQIGPICRLLPTIGVRTTR